MTYLTCYPEAWFGRSLRAKMHAFAHDGDVDRHGHPLGETGKRMASAVALCGVTGSASGNEFRPVVDVLTCSRCVAKIERAQEATS